MAPSPARPDRLWAACLLVSAALALSACASGPTSRPDSAAPTASDNTGNSVPSSMDVPDLDGIEQTQEVDIAVLEAVPAHVDTRIKEAMQRAANGQADVAIQILSALTSEPSGGYLASYNLGVVQEGREERALAVKSYMQCLTKNPEFTPALRNIARLYARAGQANDAEALVARLAEKRPDNLGHQVVALEVKNALGKHEEVIRGARDILRKDERHVDALVVMAWANFELGRLELAEAVLKMALEIAPRRAEIFYLSGLIDLEWERSQPAIANFRQAIDLQPVFPEARNNLGVLYNDARDHDAAVAEFQAALRDYPSFKEALLNLGNTYKAMARFGDAENAFKRSLALDSNFADALFNLAILYLESEVPGMEPVARYQKSIEIFKQYQAVAKSRPKDDPSDNYIQEATRAIETTKQREEMMRRGQMNPAEGTPAEGTPGEGTPAEGGQSE